MKQKNIAKCQIKDLPLSNNFKYSYIKCPNKKIYWQNELKIKFNISCLKETHFRYKDING